MRPDIMLVAVFRAAGFLDRHFHSLQNLFALNPLIACYRIGNNQQFRPGVNVTGYHKCFTHVLFLPLALQASRP